MAESDFGNPEAFFARHGGVPKNPVLIRETLSVLRDPACSAADLVEILEREPAISSKCSRPPTRFSSAPQIHHLAQSGHRAPGNHNISRIALSASLGATGGGQWTDFWRPLHLRGHVGRHIGQFTGAYTKQEEEELFSMACSTIWA